MAAYFAKLPDDDPLRCPISLFGVMERGRLETAHTAVLAWMLDPRREHGFKDTLLLELLRRLCGPDQAGAILVVDKCEPEFAIDDGRHCASNFAACSPPKRMKVLVNFN